MELIFDGDWIDREKWSHPVRYFLTHGCIVSPTPWAQLVFDMTFTVANKDAIIYLVRPFKQYCEPRKNKTVSLYNLNWNKQKFWEKFDTFLTAHWVLIRQKLWERCITRRVTHGKNPLWSRSGESERKTTAIWWPDTGESNQVCQVIEMSNQYMTTMSCETENILAEVKNAHRNSDRSQINPTQMQWGMTSGKQHGKPVMTTSFRKINCQYGMYAHITGIKIPPVRDREWHNCKRKGHLTNSLKCMQWPVSTIEKKHDQYEDSWLYVGTGQCWEECWPDWNDPHRGTIFKLVRQQTCCQLMCLLAWNLVMYTTNVNV